MSIEALLFIIYGRWNQYHDHQSINVYHNVARTVIKYLTIIHTTTWVKF